MRDQLASAYAVRKRRVLQSHHGLSHIGRADHAGLQAIADAYAAQTGVVLAPYAHALVEGMQEDFVILHDESAEGADVMRARLLSVCFPSNWNPAEKLGLDFTAIHAPHPLGRGARGRAGRSAGFDERCRRRLPRHDGSARAAVCRTQAVLTVVLGPLVFTDSMPASRPAAALYIWLLPMTWWLPALRLK